MIKKILETNSFQIMQEVSKAIRPSVAQDRLAFIESRAFAAQTAAFHGDVKSTYAIVKQLAGKSPSAEEKTIKKTYLMEFIQDYRWIMADAMKWDLIF